MDAEFGWLTLPWVVTSITILVAVACEKILKWPRHTHPMGIVSMLAQRMGDTLAKQKRALPSWLGIVLWSLLFLPLMATIALIVNLAEYRLLLEGVLLILCIPTFENTATTERIYRYILKDKKQLARDTLQPWVLRDTSPLSALGVAKACAEMRFLRNLHQLATPLILYAIGGIYLALGYRLTYETMQAWNPKLPRFADFGVGLRYMTILCQWPAALCYTLILAISAPSTVLAAIKEVRYHSPGAWFLGAVGARLDCQFCGPAQYQGNIQRTARVGSETPIKLDHLKLISPLLFEANFLFVIICLGIASL